MLNVENLNFRYSKFSRPVLNGASLELKPGEVGILLGRGLNIDQAREALSGVTLESLVVAVRVARAMKVRASRGEVDLAKLPLLMHVDEILSEKKEVSIPWESFTFVQKDEALS